MSEELYDSEIAPELLRLADRCKELGMPFVATVEYSPGERGTTASGIAASNMDMQVAYLAARYGSRLDELMIAMARRVREQGVPHSCIVLQRLGVEPAVKDRTA